MANVYELMASFRRELLRRDARAQARVLAAYEQAWQAIEREVARLAASDDSSIARRRERLLALERQVVEAIRELARETGAGVRREQAQAVERAERHALALTQSMLDAGTAAVGAELNSLPLGALREFVGMTSAGSPLREAFDELAGKIGAESGASLRRAFAEGITLGWNPDRIARHVRRAVDARGDDLARQPAPVRRLNLLARSSVLTSYREATRATYQANKQLVRGWRWTASRGANTCLLCWARDGQVFPLDQPMVSHMGCRCTKVPVLHDEKQPRETGAEAFAKLEPGVQRDLLGERAYEAYREGRVDIQDFVTVRDHERWGGTLVRRSLDDAIAARGKQAGGDSSGAPGGGRWLGGGLRGGWERGAASRRGYDPDAIGVPVRRLSAERIRITDRGVEQVERHLSRFGQDDANDVMTGRLRRIAAGEIAATERDRNFYAHELREYVRYKRLGYEQGQPADETAAHRLWNDAHTATLEDYGLSDDMADPLDHPLYHPDAVVYF